LYGLSKSTTLLPDPLRITGAGVAVGVAVGAGVLVGRGVLVGFGVLVGVGVFVGAGVFVGTGVFVGAVVGGTDVGATVGVDAVPQAVKAISANRKTTPNKNERRMILSPLQFLWRSPMCNDARLTTY
jgi:hypothetical protein